MNTPKLQLKWMNSLVILAALALPVNAVDGVVLINQNAALAGNVTPGDTAGFPVTISLPGSYKLSSNLVVPDSNTTAIEVAADDVKLDLNGFAIIGPVVCTQGFINGSLAISCSPTGSGRGVTNPRNSSNISVFNGTVRGMGLEGISFSGGAHHRVENVRAIGNGQDGILVGFNPFTGLLGDSSMVVSCTASGNGLNGIEVRGSALDNIAEGNGVDGIDSAGITMNNVARGNLAFGIRSAGSFVSRNFAASNGFGGIVVFCPADFQANLADGNVDSSPSHQIGFVNTSGCVRLNNSPQ